MKGKLDWAHIVPRSPRNSTMADSVSSGIAMQIHPMIHCCSVWYTAVSTKVVRKSVRDNTDRYSGKYTINFDNKNPESILAVISSLRCMDSELLLKLLGFTQTTFRHCRVRFYAFFFFFWATFVETAICETWYTKTMPTTELRPSF